MERAWPKAGVRRLSMEIIKTRLRKLAPVWGRRHAAAAARPPGTAPGKTHYCAFNMTEESFLGMNITRADTGLARLRGLLGRMRLKSGEGIWVVRSQGIHTIGLLFPIDVIFLDAKDRVIDLVEHMNPFSISAIRIKCASILELPCHSIYASQTHVGDQLLICELQNIETCLKPAEPAKVHPVSLRGRQAS
jgi:uncharacterized membrane protein (UPF0127 family)